LIVLGYVLSGDVLIYQALLSFGIFFISCLILCLFFIPKVSMMWRMKSMTSEQIRKMTTGYSGGLLGKSSIMNQTSVTSTPQNAANQQTIDRLEKEIKNLKEKNKKLAKENTEYYQKYQKVKKRYEIETSDEESSLSPCSEQELEEKSNTSSEGKADIETMEDPVIIPTDI